MRVVTGTDIKELKLASRGKVRDMYELDGQSLLIVTTDRMSAFDVIMQEPIPYKGVVLNAMTGFWMKRFEPLVKNHLLLTETKDFPAVLAPYADELDGRAVVARKATPLPIECIVRGHITGSAWSEYSKSGTVCGRTMPEGLLESSKLEEPIFTPSTKAALGQHDENISEEQAAALVGEGLYDDVRTAALKMFAEAREYAETRGIIIADTKFEFGLVQGELTLIDEVLTPDSSRFWPSEGYEPGKAQPSFDKQYLRDWLSAQPWNKQAPAPHLPQEVIDETARKYAEAYSIITGGSLSLSS